MNYQEKEKELNHSASIIQELKSRLDDALESEDMVHQLSDKNLNLESVYITNIKNYPCSNYWNFRKH